MNEPTAETMKWVNILGWLADAPLFIDAPRVGNFYDAVVRPDAEGESVTLGFSRENHEQSTKTMKGGLDFSPGEIVSWLSNLIPGIKLTGSLESAQATGAKEGTTTSMALRLINNPQRQLEHLIFHYLANQPGRLRLVEDPGQSWWREPAEVCLVPRQFVFLDLPGRSESQGVRTKMIPMAAEFSNGKTVLLYDRLVKRLSEKAESLPIRYPERALGAKDLPSARREYWSWFNTNFAPIQAMLVVEEAASENGRIQWINFRLPLNDAGDTLHVSFSPGGGYDTGTFGHDLIMRGADHGIRLVGTMRSEPGVNVMAVYDK